MSYQVLARKWRPRDFSEIVGQAHVVQALSNALEQNRLHHAYLFSGTRGVGKTTLARILAKALNCEQGMSAQPCGQCAACRDVDAGRFADLLEVDAASRTKVEQTLELLEQIPFAPIRGRYKVYLIDEVHMFSRSSFNALLKTLEEPPAHVKFLLATTDPQKVPVTVLSRCLHLHLKRLSVEQIRNQFEYILRQEQVDAEAQALEVLARMADGSMRDGLSLLDQAIAFGGGRITHADVQAMLGIAGLDLLPDLLQKIIQNDAAGVLRQIAEMAELAPDFSFLLKELVLMLHRMALLQAVPDIADSSWSHREALQALAEQLSPEDIQLFYEMALQGQRHFSLAPTPRAGFEMLALRLLAFRPVNGHTSLSSSTTVAPVPSLKQPPQAQSATHASAPIQPPPAQVDRENWHVIVSALGLKGISAQLAACSQVESWSPGHLTLRLHPEGAALRSPTAEKKLKAALESYLQQKLDLHFQLAAPEHETPAQRAQRKAQEQQARATQRLREDPWVQALQAGLDGRLLEDSVSIDNTMNEEGQ